MIVTIGTVDGESQFFKDTTIVIETALKYVLPIIESSSKALAIYMEANDKAYLLKNGSLQRNFIMYGSRMLKHIFEFDYSS